MRWQEKLNRKRIKTQGWYGCIAPDGWKDLVLLTDEMLAYIDPDYEIHQIKEKFGGLRYYFEGGKTEIARRIMWAIVSDSESQSLTVCEICGQRGELRTDEYYVRTLCDKCSDEIKTKRAELDELTD
jgi:hypothetical protein